MIVLFLSMSFGALNFAAAADDCRVWLENHTDGSAWWDNAIVSRPSTLGAGDVVIKDGLPLVIIFGPKGENEFLVRQMQKDGTLLPQVAATLSGDYYLRVGRVDTTKLKDQSKSYSGLIKMPKKKVSSEAKFVGPEKVELKAGTIVKFDVRMSIKRIRRLGGTISEHRMAKAKTHFSIRGLARVKKAGRQIIEIAPLTIDKPWRVDFTAKVFQVNRDELLRSKYMQRSTTIDAVIDPVKSIGDTYHVNYDLIAVGPREMTGELVRVTDDGVVLQSAKRGEVLIAFDRIRRIQAADELMSLDKNSLDVLKIGTTILIEVAKNEYTQCYFLMAQNGFVRCQEMNGGFVRPNIYDYNLNAIGSVWLVDGSSPLDIED